MKTIAALTIALLLTACGGGAPLSEEEIFREQAMMTMQAACAPHGGLQSWEWHTSHYPTGPLKGEVFARGWSATCGPDANGKYRVVPHLPPVI